MNTSWKGTAAEPHMLHVWELVAQRAHISAQIGPAVIEARAAGATWTQIGAVLGISAQAAHKRYAEAEQQAAAQRDRTRDHHYSQADNDQADQAHAILSGLMDEHLGR